MNSKNLFGSTQNNTNTTGGGIFGNSSNTSVQPTSLFANTSNNGMNMNSNRLIGSGQKIQFAVGTNSNQKSQNTMGSVFNQQNVNPNMTGNQGGGLFGNNTSTTNIFSGGHNQNVVGNNQPTNLFGGGGGGMFQNSTSTSNNLFPQPQNQQQGVNMLSTPQKTNNNTLYGGQNQNQNNLSFAPSNNQSNGIFQNNPQTSVFTNSVSNSNQGLFGNTNQSNVMNNQMQQQQTNVNQKGTFGTPFEPTLVGESTGDNKVNAQSKVKYYSIPAMPVYSSKSIEELKYEDYLLKQSGAVYPKQNNVSGVFTTGGVNNNNNLMGSNMQNQGLGLGLGNKSQSSLFNVGTTNTSNTSNQMQQGLNNIFQGSNNVSSNTMQQNQNGILNQNSSNNQGGGLFNNNTNKQSLFNNNNPINTLTSNTNQQVGLGLGLTNQNKPAVSLFNNQQTNQTTIQQSNNQGIMGNQQAQSTNQNQGLFNQQAQSTNQNQVGLFQNTTNTSSSLFNTSNNNQSSNQSQNTSGFFSTGPSTNQLFSNTSNNKPSTSLFDKSNNTSGGLFSSSQNTSGGIFSSSNSTINTNQNISLQNQNQQQQQYIPAPSNILGIDINSVSSVVKKAALEEIGLPDFIAMVEKEFKNNDEDFTKYYHSKPSYNYDHSHRVRERDHYVDKMVNQDYISRYEDDNKYSRSVSRYSEVNRPLSDFSFYSTYVPPQTVQKSSYTGNSSHFSGSFLHHKRKDDSYLKDFNYNKNVIEISQKSSQDMYHHKKRKVEGEESYKVKSNFFEENFDYNRESQNKEKNLSRISNTTDNVIKLTLNVQSEDLSMTLDVNKNNKVEVLKEYIAEKLKDLDIKRKEKVETYKYRYKGITKDNVSLLKDNRFMKDNSLIKDYGVNNYDTILVILALKVDSFDKNEALLKTEHAKKTKPHKKSLKNSSELAPLNLLPRPPREGYLTNPDFNMFGRMTLEELKNVEDFEIFNQYGKVHWRGPIDLTELNLADIVSITQSSVDLYKGKIELPPREIGLNKALNITLKVTPEFDISVPSNKNAFINMLEKEIGNYEGKFTDYDEKNQEVKFFCKGISDKI